MNRPLEMCIPQCPECRNYFLYTYAEVLGLYWRVCSTPWCRWRGLVRFWREQS